MLFYAIAYGFNLVSILLLWQLLSGYEWFGFLTLIHTYSCSSCFAVCDKVSILQCWIWYVFYTGCAFGSKRDQRSHKCYFTLVWYVLFFFQNNFFIWMIFWMIFFGNFLWNMIKIVPIIFFLILNHLSINIKL